VFPAFRYQAGNSIRPDVVKRHFHHEIQDNRITGVKYLVRLHHTSEVIELEQGGLHTLPAKEATLDVKMCDKIR
jgi:hypothetical protein